MVCGNRRYTAKVYVGNVHIPKGVKVANPKSGLTQRQKMFMGFQGRVVKSFVKVK